MGLSLGFSSSSLDEPKIIEKHTITERIIERPLPNPRPDNYKIIRTKQMGKHLIMEIKYLDCVNYEGKKILVFKCLLDELLKQKLIDPHFSDNDKYISPIARFEPTKAGWSYAELFCMLIV